LRFVLALRLCIHVQDAQLNLKKRLPCACKQKKVLGLRIISQEHVYLPPLTNAVLKTPKQILRGAWKKMGTWVKNGAPERKRGTWVKNERKNNNASTFGLQGAGRLKNTAPILPKF